MFLTVRKIIFASKLAVFLTGCPTAMFAGDYFKKDKIVVDLYTPIWLNTPNTVKSITHKSFGISYSWGSDLQIKKSRFSLYYGIGYDYNLVESNADLDYSTKTQSHSGNWKWYGISEEPEQNSVHLHYVDLPFEIRFRTQTKYPFRVYLGVKVGYLFSSKYEFEQTEQIEYSRKKIDELNHFRYGVTMRVGYGMLNFYSYYGLDNMLLSSQPKRINQFALGLSLLIN